MRRAVAVVLGTVAGTSLMVLAKLGNAPSLADDGGAGVDVVVGGSSAAPSRVGAVPSRTPGPSPRPGPSTPRSGATTPRPGGTTPRSTPPRSTRPPGPTDGTYPASAAVRGGRYGTLTMTVTISGGRIAAIAASETDPTEASCYRHACPTLTTEAISAQSAAVATYSGATYTTQAYRAALSAVLRSANG